MKKELEIGKDYGFVFGLTPDMGKMVYNGQDSWTGTNTATKQSHTAISPRQTAAALAYINSPSYGTGLR